MDRRAHFVAGMLRRGPTVLLGRRAAGRRLSPGAWDLPGGHVEPGEPSRRAVRRELWEELGVLVEPDPAPTLVFEQPDWLLECWVFDAWSGEPANRAPEEHDEIGWCDLGRVRTLPLADEGLRRALVARLLPERQHCVALVTGPAGRQVARLRQRWDPVAASGAPAHLTISYPEEEPVDGEPLRERVREATARLGPFRVRLDGVAGPLETGGAVAFRVTDVDGGWQRARRELLAGGSALRVEPHVTIAHPCTCTDPGAVWRALRGTRLEATIDIGELAVTRTRGATMTVRARHRL